jgi:mandelate racemase
MLNILGSSGEGLSVGAIVSAVDILRGQGHTMVKAFISDPDEMNLLRGAMNDIGNEVSFAIDIMHRWDTNTTVRTLNEFEDLKLAWVEDPIAHDDLRGLAHIADAVQHPICSGEDCFYIYEPRAMVDAARIRYLSIDLMRCGGITGWRKISAAAEGSGVDVVSHGYPLVAVHLICGTRNATFVEDFSMFGDVFEDTVEVQHGLLRAPHVPGIGIGFSKEALAGSLFEHVK